MNILALDLGTHYGWAEVFEGNLTASGHIDLKKLKGAKRFATFRELLEARLYVTKHTEPEPIKRITHIAYEKVMAHRGTSAAHMYGAFEMLVALIAYDNGIELVGYGVGEIKKFATGKGNAKKDKVIAAVRSMGYDVKDDNEADAICIGLLAHSRLT